MTGGQFETKSPNPGSTFLAGGLVIHLWFTKKKFFF